MSKYKRSATVTSLGYTKSFSLKQVVLQVLNFTNDDITITGTTRWNFEIGINWNIQYIGNLSDKWKTNCQPKAAGSF